MLLSMHEPVVSIEINEHELATEEETRNVLVKGWVQDVNHWEQRSFFFFFFCWIIFLFSSFFLFFFFCGFTFLIYSLLFWHNLLFILFLYLNSTMSRYTAWNNWLSIWTKGQTKTGTKTARGFNSFRLLCNFYQ